MAFWSKLYINFFISVFLDVQIVFEGIKGTPVKDDNEVRNNDDEKEQEQNEHDAAELTWPALSQKSSATGRAYIA